jgi:hypothetical protein
LISSIQLVAQHTVKVPLVVTSPLSVLLEGAHVPVGFGTYWAEGGKRNGPTALQPATEPQEVPQPLTGE